MPRRSSFVLILALMGLAPEAHAAATAQQSCEAAMELASGKYAQCRLVAESKFSKTLDAAKRTAALTKCSTNLGGAFAKATTKYGVSCAASEPSSAFDAYLQQCTDDTAAAAAGASLGGGCAADLATCESDLAICESSLLAPLLRTGQTASYGAGSDGDLQKGVVQAYVDNGDGTVTDTKTGLMWEKKSDDGSIHDKDDVYTLGLTVPPYTLNGTAVTTFLAALNAGSGFAGHTDWRLPNLTELESIRNLGTVSPAVSAVFNTGCGAGSGGNPGCTVLTCSCTLPASYWSSSSYAGPAEFAWEVRFGDGTVDSEFKDTDSYVRAVRGGS
ncbi:MAG: DUF1566 domain-containing protein [Candidatus Binatia bacterium]